MKAKAIPLHPLIKSIKQGARPTLDDFIEAFGLHFPWLHDLEHTQQDPEWHAEGNVYIHTQMVLEQIYSILEAQPFSEAEKLTLILSALFHDIAKPVTTKTRVMYGKERIVSPKHADAGRSYIAYKLLNLGLSATEARCIMAIVGHHHDPKQLILKDKSTSHYKQLARLAPLHMLYWLELADMRGRTCDDLDEQIDIIEMFKLAAQEEKLWHTQDPYEDWKQYLKGELKNYPEATQDLVIANAIRNYEDEQIYTPHEALSRSYDYRDNYANLIVTCGPSGSGKSTWISQNHPDHTTISLDQLREDIAGKRADQSKNGQVMQAAKEQLKDALRNNKNIIWDATSLILSQRSAISQLGFNYQANVTLAVFHKAESLIVKQNQDRKYSLPQHILAKQFRNLNFPYANEAHHISYIES